MLESYSDNEKDFIIKNGIVILENSKKFLKENKIDYFESNENYKLLEKEKTIKELEKKIKNYELQRESIYNDARETSLEDKRYLMGEIKKVQDEKNKILDQWNLNLRDKTELETIKYKTYIEELNKKVNELEKKNKWYYDLYESTEKGVNLENELYPKLLEYNDKHMNSIWEITHVGQVLSEKGDFHFKHKYLNKNIIIDTKNNIQNNPVNNLSLEKFEKDILSEKTNSIGGILLAKEKITKRKNFEIKKIMDKYAFYVSNFNLNNVSFIFTLLDQLLELNNNKNDNDIIETKLKQIYINNYKTEKLRLDKLEREKKEITFKINSIVHDFHEIFNEDIDFVLNDKGIKENSSINKEKTSSDVIDYEKLEENKKIMNKTTEDKKYRTRYYLCFKNNNNENCIQYFKNNYARNQKMNKLNENKNNSLIEF
tara:strand:- start:32 stop:1315 length:1284 start_codon:yes stop_codon:yes gene_type:complete